MLADSSSVLSPEGDQTVLVRLPTSRTATRTSLIVRLDTQNRMVTKDYRRGVYKWVEGAFRNRECTFLAIESLSHRIIESMKIRDSLLLVPYPLLALFDFRDDCRGLFRVFAFFAFRSCQAACRAPESTSLFALDSTMWVVPILPQPPGIGKNISGSSSTNWACCSGESIRLP